MPAQRRSQGLADLSHRSSSALQETDDPQLEGQYGGFKCVNLGSIGHELRVFGDKLLVCMCFRCVKISLLLSEILMNLAYANTLCHLGTSGAKPPLLQLQSLLNTHYM